MTKLFEDEFMDVQEGMLSLCLEYVSFNADKVFVYGSIEGGATSMNAFYLINGKIVWPNEVNGALSSSEQIDDSPERQLQMLSIGVDDLGRLASICEKFEQPVPTQLKLVYDNRTKKFEANYSYDPVLSGNLEVDSYDVLEKWIEDERAIEASVH